MSVQMYVRRGTKWSLRRLKPKGKAYKDTVHALRLHKKRCPKLNHKLGSPDGEQLDPTDADADNGVVASLKRRLSTTPVMVDAEDKRLIRRYTHENATLADGMVELVAHYKQCPDANKHAPRAPGEPIMIPGSSLDGGGESEAPNIVAPKDPVVR